MVNRRAGIRLLAMLALFATFGIATRTSSQTGETARQHAPGESSTSTTPSSQHAESQTAAPPATLKDDPRYRRWQFTLTWGLVILIAFVTAAAAIVVFSRGFRRWIGREKKAPTASDDVWAMHKPPDVDPDLRDDAEPGN